MRSATSPAFAHIGCCEPLDIDGRVSSLAAPATETTQIGVESNRIPTTDDPGGGIWTGMLASHEIDGCPPSYVPTGYQGHAGELWYGRTLTRRNADAKAMSPLH
jgi:hypothetical protein